MSNCAMMPADTGNGWHKHLKMIWWRRSDMRATRAAKTWWVSSAAFREGMRRSSRECNLAQLHRHPEAIEGFWADGDEWPILHVLRDVPGHGPVAPRKGHSD